MRFDVCHHFGYSVSSLEDSLRFWRDGLHFPVIYNNYLTPPFSEGCTGVKGSNIKVAMVELPGKAILELLEYDPQGPPVGRPANHPGMSHIALRLTEDKDLEEAVALAQQYGFTLSGTLEPCTIEGFKGTRACYLQNSDGMVLEVMTTAACAH